MTASGRAGQVRALSQLVASPLTSAAIFLVITVHPGPAAESTVRSLCADMANLLRTVGFRDLDGRLSCIVSLASQIMHRIGDAVAVADEVHGFGFFESTRRSRRQATSCSTSARGAWICAFGSAVWDRLFGAPRPAELHPFREFRGGKPANSGSSSPIRVASSAAWPSGFSVPSTKPNRSR